LRQDATPTDQTQGPFLLMSIAPLFICITECHSQKLRGAGARPLYRDFEPHPHLNILLLLVYCRDQGVQDTLATAILCF